MKKRPDMSLKKRNKKTKISKKRKENGKNPEKSKV